MASEIIDRAGTDGASRTAASAVPGTPAPGAPVPGAAAKRDGARAVPYALSIGAVLSPVAGTTTTGYGLALPRVLMFLPCFVPGTRPRPGCFTRARAVRWPRLWAPFALVSRRRLWLTAGSRDLVPVSAARTAHHTAHAYGWDAPLRPCGPLGAAPLTACGAGAPVLLSTAPGRRLARPLTEPRLPGLTRLRHGRRSPGTSEPRTA